MGQQRVKKYEPEEKEEKKEQKPAKPKRPERIAKKWKGKDWFAILTPKSFGAGVIAQTPATDPKTLIGRNIEISLADLLGQRGKEHQKLIFRIEKIDGRDALTKFNGYTCIREFVSRVVRKRAQKVEVIGNIKTKDDWILQISSVAIMNRNVEKQIQKKARAWINSLLSETAGRSGIDDFVKFIIAGSVQHKVKKQGSKIYPIRFFEISKIEVLKAPATDSLEGKTFKSS